MMLPAVIRDNPKDLIGALLEASNRQTKTNRQLSRTINTLFASQNNSNQGAENFFFEDKFEKFMDSLGKQFDTLGMRLMSGLFEVSEKIEDANKNVISLVDDLTKQKEEEKKSKKADHFWEEDKEKSKVKREEAQIGVLEKILKQMGNQSLDFLFDGLSDKIGFNERISSLGDGGLSGGIMGALLTSLGLGGFKHGLFRGGLGMAKKVGLGRLFVKGARLGRIGLTGIGFVAKRLPFLAAMYAMYGAAEGLWNIDDFAGKDGVKGNRTARKVVGVATSGILSKVLELVSFGFVDVDAKTIFPIVDSITTRITGGIEAVWKTVDKQIEGWLGQNYRDFKVNISRKYAGFMEGAGSFWDTVKSIFTGGEFKNPFSSPKMKLQSDPELDAMFGQISKNNYGNNTEALLAAAKDIAINKKIKKNPAGEPIGEGYCARAVKTAISKVTGKYPSLNGGGELNARDMHKFFNQEGWPEMQIDPEAIPYLPAGYLLQYTKGGQHISITAGQGKEYSDAVRDIKSMMQIRGIPRVFKMGDKNAEVPITTTKADEMMHYEMRLNPKTGNFEKFNMTLDQDQRNSSLAKSQIASQTSSEAFNMSTAPVIIQETNNNNINQVPTTWDTSLYNSSFDFYVLKLMGKV